MEEVKDKTNLSLEIVARWLHTRGLQLSVNKCKYVKFTGRRLLESVDIHIDGHRIEEVQMLKYLGVTLQKNCRFTEHVLKICDSAERMMRSLNALMSKKRAPRASKRRLLASTVTSAMLYAVPAW
ncbi:uncharacterized protein LOC142317474 [Lycorma delicatula]|uniref:uncharacterized protein LOC142317474 n=1 Tax=Lycorma delicatula TaxID=130591 RepID=UPI003F50E5B0